MRQRRSIEAKGDGYHSTDVSSNKEQRRGGGGKKARGIEEWKRQVILWLFWHEGQRKRAGHQERGLRVAMATRDAVASELASALASFASPRRLTGHMGDDDGKKSSFLFSKREKFELDV